MKTKTRKTSQKFSAKTLAIVAARFNDEICQGLIDGALKLLEEKGFKKTPVFRVPGAFEIPLAAKKLALTKKYAAIICLGAVIRGDTAHFDYVCQGAMQGIMQVNLETKVPCMFGVLTVDTLAQAQERASDNDFNKGRESALAALEMAELLGGLRG